MSLGLKYWVRISRACSSLPRLQSSRQRCALSSCESIMVLNYQESALSLSLSPFKFLCSLVELGMGVHFSRDAILQELGSHSLSCFQLRQFKRVWNSMCWVSDQKLFAGVTDKLEAVRFNSEQPILILLWGSDLWMFLKTCNAYFTSQPSTGLCFTSETYTLHCLLSKKQYQHCTCQKYCQCCTI